MYKLICMISILVRQFCLPNPFECFGEKAALYNWLAGFILAPITYILVGMIYDKESFPALGSLLYLLTYIGLTGLLWLLGLTSFAWWAILSMIAVILLVIIIGRKFSDKLPRE